MDRLDATYGRRPAPAGGVNLVRWGAVWSGVLVGVGLLALFSLLWLALGYGSNYGVFSHHIEWWLGGTAIGAIFVGGLVSGLTSSARGVLAGLLNSMVLWALVAVVALVVEIGGASKVVNSTTSVSGVTNQLPNNTLWASFWSMLIALGAAVLGGVIGGAMRRDTPLAPVDTRGDVVDAYPVETDEAGYDYDESTYDDAAGRHARR
jgi:hypothetical protein